MRPPLRRPTKVTRRNGPRQARGPLQNVLFCALGVTFAVRGGPHGSQDAIDKNRRNNRGSCRPGQSQGAKSRNGCAGGCEGAPPIEERGSTIGFERTASASEKGRQAEAGFGKGEQANSPQPAVNAARAARFNVRVCLQGDGHGEQIQTH